MGTGNDWPIQNQMCAFLDIQVQEVKEEFGQFERKLEEVLVDGKHLEANNGS